VADGGLEMHGLGRPVGTRCMTPAADQNSEAGLLEYGTVVVVGVPHRPAAHVLSRLCTAPAAVCSQTVAVRQHLKRVVLIRRQLKYATHLHDYCSVCMYKSLQTLQTSSKADHER